MRRIVGILILVAIATPALAQDAAGHVSFGPLFDWFVGLVVPVLGTLALGLWLYVQKLVKDKTGIDIEEITRNIDFLHNENIQKAAENAAGKLIAQYGSSVKDWGFDTNPAVAKVVNDLIAGVPEAVGKFGITNQALADLIKAKFGILTATPATPATPPVA